MKRKRSQISRRLTRRREREKRMRPTQGLWVRWMIAKMVLISIAR